MSRHPDPVEVLAFVSGYSDMPGEEWRARFPEWARRVDKATARYRSETGGGRQSWIKGDAMVDSEYRAVQHWVFLPLMREALAGHQPNIPS